MLVIIVTANRQDNMKTARKISEDQANRLWAESQTVSVKRKVADVSHGTVITLKGGSWLIVEPF